MTLPLLGPAECPRKAPHPPPAAAAVAALRGQAVLAIASAAGGCLLLRSCTLARRRGLGLRLTCKAAGSGQGSPVRALRALLGLRRQAGKQAGRAGGRRQRTAGAHLPRRRRGRPGCRGRAPCTPPTGCTWTSPSLAPVQHGVGRGTRDVGARGPLGV
jgi:hypothetical protein